MLQSNDYVKCGKQLHTVCDTVHRLPLMHAGARVTDQTAEAGALSGRFESLPQSLLAATHGTVQTPVVGKSYQMSSVGLWRNF